MQYFSIDTTTQELKLALYNSKTNTIFELKEFVGRKQSEQLHVKIREILLQAELKVSDIDVIVVNLGPGSYTSLRLGIATAKGLALPFQNIKVLGVNSFDLYKELYQQDDKNSAILIENNQAQVYLQTQDETVVIDKEEIKDYLTDGMNIYGSGFDQYAEFLENYSLQANTDQIEALDIIKYIIKHDIKDSTLEPLYLKPLTYKKYEYKL